MRYAFEHASIPTPLVAVADGDEAIRYLSGRGRFADREAYPLPCVLITDIKMPKVNGFELLAWLRQQEQFRNLPAIAISSSCHEGDVIHAMELGAQEYFTKPARLERLVEFARRIDEQWLAPHCRKQPDTVSGTAGLRQ